MSNPSKQEYQRIASLDVIRGVAVLGIFMMNIQSFSMPEAAYLNPLAFGDMSSVNAAAWLLAHLFFDGKFMALFSILFGVGVQLSSERWQAKGLDAWRLHRRRMLWLLVFGLGHAYFIWSGDILVAYAICGLLIFFALMLHERMLLALALFLLAVGAFNILWAQWQLDQWGADTLLLLKQAWQPSMVHIQQEIQVQTSPYWQQWWPRFERSIDMQTYVFVQYSLWRISALMLLGVVFYRWRLFTGRIPCASLCRHALWLLMLGIGLSGLGVVYNFNYAWSLEKSLFGGSMFNYLGSVLTALSYLLALQAWVQSDFKQSVQRALAAVGRLAFSHYIGQSLIGLVLFTGVGFGLFGELERSSQWAVVILLWLLQVTLSLIYLRFFSQGPLEKLWRWLSYGELSSRR